MTLTLNKTCSRCKEAKAPSEFHRQKSAKDGLNWYCKACNCKAALEHYHRIDKPIVRARNLRRKYGMTVADYDAMLERQGGVCAVCTQRPVGAATFHVDHCHASGEVRGILCVNCNLALGLSSDDPARLRAMADYLEASRCL